ncbi:MAG: CoA ester lyase [Rhodospirillales bacterium]
MTARTGSPVWTSLLFVPADREDRVAKAGRSGADAVILDLEDAVSIEAKKQARASLQRSAATLRQAGCSVIVRINTPWRLAIDDIAAACAAGVDAIMVPKIEDAARLATLADMLAEYEADRHEAAETAMLALIESPAALDRLAAIAAAPRVIGLALGSEDFALTLGVEPTAKSLDLPCRQIALAAAARGQMALGLPISLTEFRDLEAYAAAVAAARAVGMTGALCIHPAQVGPVAAGFRRAPAEIAAAQAILAAWDRPDRGGRMAISVAGRMVDLPVVKRARRTLQAAEAITTRSGDEHA